MLLKTISQRNRDIIRGRNTCRNIRGRVQDIIDLSK